MSSGGPQCNPTQWRMSGNAVWHFEEDCWRELSQPQVNSFVPSSPAPSLPCSLCWRMEAMGKLQYLCKQIRGPSSWKSCTRIVEQNGMEWNGIRNQYFQWWGSRHKGVVRLDLNIFFLNDREIKFHLVQVIAILDSLLYVAKSNPYSYGELVGKDKFESLHKCVGENKFQMY